MQYISVKIYKYVELIFVATLVLRVFAEFIFGYFSEIVKIVSAKLSSAKIHSHEN